MWTGATARRCGSSSRFRIEMSMPPAERVLVVDDDPDMAEAMALSLESAGYETATAANGLDALEAVESRMPALILLDMRMPIMDGWEFSRELRRRHGTEIPI